MKNLMVVFGLILSLTTASAQASDHMRVQVEGTVKFDKTYSITCMAIGCPPSLPYFYVMLENARTTDGSIVLDSLVVEQLATRLGTDVKPEVITFQGVDIHENDQVVLDLDLIYFNSINMYMAGQVFVVEKL